jgi:hypothetical protein
MHRGLRLRLLDISHRAFVPLIGSISSELVRCVHIYIYTYTIQRAYGIMSI